MKKIALILFSLITLTASAQYSGGMFGKNPYKNLQDWDSQRMHYGYFLGTSVYDFKIEYNEEYLKQNGSNDILVETSAGFNVGLVGNLRLFEYADLRFEPGLYHTKRTLFFSHITNPTQAVREVNSTYIHMPLLLKVSSLRTGNIRPYVIGGFSESLNLSSYETSKEDNSEGRFRMKKWTTNYELGVGIDFYFPYFKLNTSLRGVFGLQDELIRDRAADSPWTGIISSIKTRGVFINFTFH